MSRLALVPFLVAAPVAALAAGAAAPAGSGAAMHVYLAGGKSVPLFAPQSQGVAVATVDGAPITLGELNAAIGAAHQGAAASAKGARGTAFGPILDRLVDVRLLELDARNMGLADLPEVKTAISVFENGELRAELERQVTKGAAPDAMEVAWLYRDAVRKWTIRSVLVPAVADATALFEQVKGGKSFVAAAKAAIAAKKASGDLAPQTVGADRMQPQVAAALAKLQKGATTPPVAVPGGFAVVHVDAIRYPEDPAARAKIRAEALDRKRTELLRAFREDLQKRYATVDEKLLASIDYESPSPGIAALQKDRRPLVTFRGEEPITVGDLTDVVAASFFHGVDKPAKEKQVNVKKQPILQELVTGRLFLSEARRRGIQRGAEFRAAVARYTREQLVGKLIERAIIPDVKVVEKDGLDYYKAHAKDFTYPAFYRLDGLAFARRKDAEAALRRLQAGTEFEWLRRNADGQVPQDKQSLQLTGTTFSANALPPAVATALAGARRGDYRLTSAAGNQWYVVRVVELTPPTEQPYPAVREGIVKKLFADDLAKAIHAYATKLRTAYAVHVYVTRIGA